MIFRLFGSEDVDLRQLMPPTVLVGPTSPQDDIPPPPPSINMSSTAAKESNENWDNLKVCLHYMILSFKHNKFNEHNFQTDSNKNVPTKGKSSLEDVRAKLAKTAKLSKLSKLGTYNLLKIK